MISRLDLMSDLLQMFEIVDVFRIPFWGVFWDNYAKTWSMEKESKNESKKVMRKWRSAAEAGASGGGGGFASQLCKEFALSFSTPCYL